MCDWRGAAENLARSAKGGRVEGACCVREKVVGCCESRWNIGAVVEKVMVCAGAPDTFEVGRRLCPIS